MEIRYAKTAELGTADDERGVYSKGDIMGTLVSQLQVDCQASRSGIKEIGGHIHWIKEREEATLLALELFEQDSDKLFPLKVTDTHGAIHEGTIQVYDMNDPAKYSFEEYEGPFKIGEAK